MDVLNDGAGFIQVTGPCTGIHSFDPCGPFPQPAARLPHVGGTTDGEENQSKGAEGAHRAKRWLEATSRAEVPWVNPDNGSAPKMRENWPVGDHSFTFDLMGFLKHGTQHGKNFYCEVKNYSGYSNLNDEYLDFLAKCYVMLSGAKAAFCDHFMWIAWHPHSVTSWSELTTTDWVRKGVERNADRIFDAGDADTAKMIDADLCARVAERTLIIILSEKQEELLTLSTEHLALIRADEVRRGARL